ncbi:MAG: mechanosensitive ion channel family protein [Coprobacillaceae bacterium]
MEEIIKHLDSIFTNGLISSGLTIIITIIILLLINRFIKKLIKKRWADNDLVAQRVRKIILWTIALSTIFVQIKPLQALSTTLLASGGIFAVIIGLASQEAASSMINGAMIFAYKPYSINDNISIPTQNIRGKVLDITLRHTVLETIEKTQLIVPNTIMNQSIIENISNIPNKKANYLLIDISYDSDMDNAIDIIQKLASKHSACIDPRNTKEKKQGIPMVPIHCMEFKESSISLRATIYSKDSGKGFEMLSDLRKQIIKEFEEQGISIPYPHRVVVSNKNQ